MSGVRRRRRVLPSAPTEDLDTPGAYGVGRVYVCPTTPTVGKPRLRAWQCAWDRSRCGITRSLLSHSRANREALARSVRPGAARPISAKSFALQAPEIGASSASTRILRGPAGSGT